ncbi:hypothetical protein F5H01DRAFT_343651 [Linnemannia elongata]|nr:hypothetical protein F5H01DRAFT_343651 [Linnemannia elongata]
MEQSTSLPMTNVLMLSSILLVFLCFLVQLSYENYANILHLHHSHPSHYHHHLHSPSPHSPLLSPASLASSYRQTKEILRSKATKDALGDTPRHPCSYPLDSRVCGSCAISSQLYHSPFLPFSIAFIHSLVLFFTLSLHSHPLSLPLQKKSF